MHGENTMKTNRTETAATVASTTTAAPKRCHCGTLVLASARACHKCEIAAKKAEADKAAAERARKAQAAADKVAAQENMAAFLAAVDRGETFPEDILKLRRNGRQIVVAFPTGGGFTAYLPKTA